MRKLTYNMTITLVSVVVAVLIGGIEALSLLQGQFGLEGGVWNGIAALDDNFTNLGFAVIGVFLIAWALSYAIYRWKKLDDIDLPTARIP